VGDPLPPLANIPKAVEDLAAVQRGSRIIVQFTVPERTTEGIAMRMPPSFDLRIGTASPPFDAAARAAWAAEAQRVSGTPPYSIPAGPWIGKEVTIGVLATGENGKTSNWSNFANVPVVAPPETPAAFRPEANAAGVQLSWRGPPGEFLVFRRGPDEPGFTRLAEVAELAYLDQTVAWGKPYAYVVQRIVKLPESRHAESELSAEASITPRDTFPPTAPATLRAAAGIDSIELSWDGNPETDLAGYRIYRASPGQDFTKLADVPPIPTYSDRAAERGIKYQYAVTALDQAGNESGKSGIADAAIPN